MAINTPRRVTALPENALPGELFFLTQQSPGPADQHLFGFTPEVLDRASSGPPAQALVAGASRVAVPSAGLGDLAASTRPLPAIFAASSVYWVATSQASGGDNLLSVGVAASVPAPDNLLLSFGGQPDRTLPLSVVPGGDLTIGGVQVARYAGIYPVAGSLARTWAVDLAAVGRQVRFGLLRGGEYLQADGTYDAGSIRDPGHYVRLADMGWLNWLPQARIPQRFDIPVGASPATLPVGTHTIAVLLRARTGGDDDYFPMTIPLSLVPAASTQLSTAGHHQGQDNRLLGLTASYNTTTRVLTYAPHVPAGLNGFVNEIRAIGEA